MYVRYNKPATTPWMRSIAVVFFLGLFIGLPARAQVRLNSPALARDSEALFMNPANLLLDDFRSPLELSLGQFRASGGGDLVQFHHYNNTFSEGASLSPAESDLILHEWFGPLQKGRMRYAVMNVQVTPVALTARGYKWGAGLGVRLRSFSQVGLTRGLFQLLLRGTNQNADLPIDISVRSMTLAEASLGFSYLIPKKRIAIGVAPKMVFGLHYAEATLESDLSLRSNSITHQFGYVVRTAGRVNYGLTQALDASSVGLWQDLVEPDIAQPNSFIAGTGFGLDVGYTQEIRKHLIVAASLTDVGFVRWSESAESLQPADSLFHFGGFEVDFNRLNDEFDGDMGAYVDDVLSSLYEDSYEETVHTAGAFRTALPTAFHTGATLYLARGRWLLNGGSSIGLAGVPGNLGRRPSMYMSTEWRFGKGRVIPVRAGAQFGGSGAAILGLGIGLKTPVYGFNLGVAVTPQSNLIGNGSRFALNLSMVNIRI